MKKKAPKTAYESPVTHLRKPLETTVLRCQKCGHTVMWEGRPELQLHRCGLAATGAMPDAYTMDHHPMPHGAKRES